MPDIDAAVVERCAKSLWATRYGSMKGYEVSKDEYVIAALNMLHAADYPALVRRVGELEGALRFYADSKGYNVSEVYSGGEFQGCKHGDAITDKGRRARQALMGGANNG
jgi:hypothetical protein